MKQQSLTTKKLVKIMEDFIRTYYKIINTQSAISVIVISLSLAIPSFLVFNINMFFLILIPVLLFTLAKLAKFGVLFCVITLFIGSKEKRKQLKRSQLNKYSSITIKQFAKMFKIRPHTAYAVASVLERRGDIIINYSQNGILFDTKPDGFSTIVLMHRDNNT